jgi:hypothetical protein
MWRRVDLVWTDVWFVLARYKATLRHIIVPHVFRYQNVWYENVLEFFATPASPNSIASTEWFIRRSPRTNNYEPRNNLPMKMKLDECRTGLQNILKLGCLLLETQADTTLHVHECFSQHGCKDRSIWVNGVNRADRYRVRVSKYTVLPIFVLSVNYCVIYKCCRRPPPSESPCRPTSYSLQKGNKDTAISKITEQCVV